MKNTFPVAGLAVIASLWGAPWLHAADAPIPAVAAPAVAAAPAAPEILTPKPAPTPRINSAKVFGVRPGSPFLFFIAATGDRPMTFSATGLPAGLTLDPANGHITGVLKTTGEFNVTLTAKNALGAAEKPLRIVVGEEIALTPALGWNSYNSFGARVTQDIALRMARALVRLGLDQHGWTYVNLDDGWPGTRAGPDHAMQSDPRRFPDIKAMVDELHAMGFKAGLYSSPWVVTYGGKLGASAENPEGTAQRWGNAPKNQKVLPFAIGKYHFTDADTRQYAAWGFDYLKLDWGPVEAPETKEWQDALRRSGRDIVLSLSNNHVKNIFPHIAELAPLAQSWRTTTDISDNWGRVANDIGFAQDAWAPFARPGHYNDADMLVVGYVGGWSGVQLHPTKLTPDEQYTHLSLWSLLTSPMLIGCDVERMDDFTLGLLSNDEVLEVNQDPLCKQAVQVNAGRGSLKVYAKPLDDGSIAVGLFNTGADTATVTATWADLKLTGPQRVRDLWRQKDVGVFSDQFEARVASHGVVLVRLFPHH